MRVPVHGALLVLAISAAPASAQTASAQTWPERPVRFITSQAAGNATDIIARITADQLGTRIGQPVVVENRPGFSTSGTGTLKDAQDYVNLQHKAWGRVVREIGVQPE